MAEKSNKATLREEVKKHIIKGISEGRYGSGERIVETRLAKELEISQAPVREAVLELSIIGLLEERPYAGSFVRNPDRDEINNHYKVRNILESFAAEQAAQVRPEEKLQEMRDVLEEMRECKDMDYFLDLDHHFHRLIMEATGNDVLERLWLTTSAYETTYNTLLTKLWSMSELYEAHLKIYKVIAAGNHVAAAAEMYLHIDGFRTGVIESMESDEE